MTRIWCALGTMAVFLGGCSSPGGSAPSGSSETVSGSSSGATSGTGASGSGAATGSAGSPSGHGGGSGGSSGSSGQSTSGGSGDGASGASEITDAGDDGGEPTLLSQAGLFSDVATRTLAPGVYPYEPSYALWSDGATKKRWAFIPLGKQIDTSDMNFWLYPVGTKFFKEFTFNGQLVETRMIQKTDNSTWYYVAFQWNAQGTEAVAVPNGVLNATPPDSNGITHDIPAQNDCQECHDPMQDHVLGFTALQLDHSLDADASAGEVNLAKINTMGWLTNAPPSIELPGDAVAQEALGYLHANCGLCHNEHSHIYLTSTQLNLWQDVTSLSTVEATNTYTSAVCQPTMGSISNNAFKIVPGSPSTSAIYELMDLRATVGVYDSSANMRQMPPLATKIVDSTGVAAVAAWINELGKDAAGCPDQ
jgi:hypothetical protein